MRGKVVSALLATCLWSGPLAAAEATGRIELTVVVPARFGAADQVPDEARRTTEPVGERSVNLDPAGYCADGLPCQPTLTADYH